MKYTIGVDVGGTNIRLALCHDGEIIRVIKQKTQKVKNATELVDQIVAMYHQIGVNDNEVKGVGVGVPGPVQQKEGYVHFLTNLELDGFNLKDMLVAKLHLNVVVGNDAKVAALAEAKLGAGKGYHVVQYITLSTGIGGGLVIDGKLFYSSLGFAQEIGNMNLVPNGRRQNSNMNAGSFESECSGTALVSYCHEHGLMVKHAGEMFTLASSGNETAQQLKRIWLEKTARSLATIAAVLEPDIFVFGGGLMLSQKYFFAELYAEFNKYVFPILQNKIKFAQAEYDQEAGIIGASLLID